VGPELSGLAGLTAAQVAGVLGLLPHREGGYFRETYRSPVMVPIPAGTRSLCTAILYLLTEEDPSRFHRLRFDEVWFFHLGAPVEMVFLDPVETLVVGPEAPQALAPGGRWMAARIAALPAEGRAAPQTSSVPGTLWALVGCVVNPGFEYDDFEAGEREALLAAYPQGADHIRALS
jgi:predicted cupin superfamily sugar epimerase